MCKLVVTFEKICLHPHKTMRSTIPYINGNKFPEILCVNMDLTVKQWHACSFTSTIIIATDCTSSLVCSVSVHRHTGFEQSHDKLHMTRGKKGEHMFNTCCENAVSSQEHTDASLISSQRKH
jgi:hypothetical protein